MYPCIISTLRQREIKHTNYAGSEAGELTWLVTVVDYVSQSAH